MTSSDATGTRSSSVTMATESAGTYRDPDLDLRLLSNRVKALEQNKASTAQSDRDLKHGIRELERSERSLLRRLHQQATAFNFPSMQHTQRLDERLHMLREEVRTMTQEKERGERVWRERLQRCQRQLKAKEDEMSLQSQYFENFKAQLQHKLGLARDREQSLQNRIYTLEKQLLDMTVSAATGTTTMGSVRITAGTVTHWEERERLLSMRGEGEGEEERKEEMRRQWQPSVGVERQTSREGDKVKTEKDTQEGKVNDATQNSNETRLQGFILSLQEDLRVLLEREEGGMTERRALVEQLQEAQENSHFLGCKVEEVKAEVRSLKLSESSLMEEVEELREENHRLQQIIGDAADQTPGLSSTSPDPPSYTRDIEQSSVGSPGETTAEPTDNKKEDHPSAVKSESPPETYPLNLFHHPDSESNPSRWPVSLKAETLDELNPGAWCSTGIQESPSEESDALRDAYRSLGFGEDLEVLREERDGLRVSLQRAREQLQVMTQENTRLKLQVRRETEELEVEVLQGSSEEKTITLPTGDDDLVQALNQENRALADRIQELLAHIELREEEIRREETELRERVTELGLDRVRLEQENQEQGCLITELTMKTEDDLNTIMELQQRIVESQQVMEKVDKEVQSEYVAGISGSCRLNLEECVDSLVESVINGEETYVRSDDSTTEPVSPREENDSQNTLRVSSLTDEMDQLTKFVQSLKTEREELSANIISLRDQQGDVALSVQTQTEAKQQLTRTVWGLKEEKDKISQSVAVLRKDREQLSRTVCVLREEKEQLAKSLSGLERAKEELAIGKETREEIVQSLKCLHTERDQLSQAVLFLEQEREEITNSLKCLKEQRELEQSSHNLQEEREKLTKSLSNLRDEKERAEQSLSCLKREENQVQLLLQDLREERNNLQAALSNKTQAEEKTQPLNPTTKTAETQEYVQEQSDLMREIEALGAELKRSQDELEKSHLDATRLQSELCQSEVRREEAERKLTQSADRVMELTDVANQMEEIRMENGSLVTQVQELQSKLKGLVREKTEALSVKAQIEEQYDILTAQLRAKTVALEELNSEYITLKRGKNNKDDLNTVVVSLRTRYNDIRAKYDALLKKRSQNDLDVAPLKAKLSCLVMKCQERNSLLVEMMKAMQGRGCVDSLLMQQVEQLLSDIALQEYAATFTPDNNANHSSGFTSGFISQLQHYTGGFTPDQTCSAAMLHVNQNHHNGSTPESKERELTSDRHTCFKTTASTWNHRDCSSDVAPAPAGTPKKNSPVPTSPIQNCSRFQTPPPPGPALTTECVNTRAEQLSPFESGPDEPGLRHPDTTGKSSPDQISLTRSSLSPSPRLSSARVGVSRRLSSPEKIINLHEQLQKTLTNSYQVIRGRGQQPRKSLLFSASADQGPASQPEKQKLTLNIRYNNSPPVPTATSQSQASPAVSASPVPTNKSTLFNAVALRSANVTFSPGMFTHHQYKTDTSKTATSALSSSNFPPAAMATSKAKPTSGTDISDAKHTDPAPVTPRTTTFDSHVLKCSDTDPKTTASDTTAPSVSTAPEDLHLKTPSQSDGAASTSTRVRLISAASSAQSAYRSPERNKKSARISTSARENTNTDRLRPDAPAAVRSVDVIRPVGQSSLMIGWERPPLDELGCSNGTFVYGYRVFVDGDFHKSVMSSACTKCVLENVDLNVPVHISVQTLGSNGLCSHSVNTVYRTSPHCGITAASQKIFTDSGQE